MVDELKQGENSWVDTTEQSDRVFDVDNNVILMSESVIITDGAEPLHPQQPPPQVPSASSDGQLGISERAVSAAGAAFLSAVLVNPLDVVKVFMLSTDNFSNYFIHLLHICWCLFQLYPEVFGTPLNFRYRNITCIR